MAPPPPVRGGSSNNNNNRIALALIAVVLCLYSFGLVGTAWHLPTIDRGRRSWLRRLRGKLGVASSSAGDTSSFSTVGVVVSGDVRLLAAGTDIDLSKNGISDPPPPPPVAADTDDDESAEDDEVEQPASNNTHYEILEEASDGESPIPRAKWPISIRDDEGNFENVIHPGHRAMGHADVIMSVPRFWINNPLSVHRMTLMSRNLAMQIGSCVTPDPITGSYARGDNCPVNERTIYVAIASYRDWQCRDTVTSIFSRATYPNRVRVAVTDQIVEGEDGKCNAPYKPCTDDPSQPLCMYKSQLDVFQMDAQLSIGPVFARHFGHRMYRGEYYAMQSDAHVTFTKGWDVDIIKQQESTGNEMAVLSTYLTDIDGSIDKNGNSVRNTRPIMCNTDYEEGQKNRYLRHGSQPESEPEIEGMPQLQPYWAAGFSFSRGHFVVNVPYDFYQPMIFQGEEMSIGIRGFTIGYDFYAPERSVCFHHYADGKNKRGRDKVPHYWENGSSYSGSGIKAMYRLLGIVHMNPEVDRETWDHAEESKYGLGNVRTPELFYNVFGIDVVKKVAEQKLCRFVETGVMHNQFMAKLRKDGMGIDYSQISYRFKANLVNGMTSTLQ